MRKAAYSLMAFCKIIQFPSQTMKITNAQTRIAGRESALFAAVDGTEYAFGLSKDIWLGQGITLAPDGWTQTLDQRELFLDLRDSTPETPSVAIEGITDPVLVGLVIRASRQAELGPVPIPSETEAAGEISALLKSLLHKEPTE